jgi:predicted transposase/invertase (TIGR01784 family)
LFSSPDVLRELYSAIEGITVPPDTPIDINTLTDILFMERINDISFLIDNRLVVLIEHQSTINDNIPLRFLEYIGRLYEKIIDPHKKYQEKLEKIPKPEFIVLYNGMDEYPDYAELKLSSAFKSIEGLKLTGNGKIPLELIVQVYNINHGRNPEILKKCETLNGYSIFIDKVREYKETEKTLEKALPSAINYCIDKNILRDFLRKHGSEVINMIVGEWNWDTAKEVWQREALEKGKEQEKLIIAKNLLAKGSTPEFVSDITGLSLEEIKEI